MSLFDSFKERGNAFFKTGDYKEAIECYDHCIGIQPNEPVAYSNKAMCQIKTGNYIGALKSCHACVPHIQPDNPAHKKLAEKLKYRMKVASERLGITDDFYNDLLEPKNEKLQGTNEITITEVDNLPEEFRNM